MNAFPDSILQLIEAFSSFPGIGKKTAQRMAFHVLKSSSNIATQLSESVINIAEGASKTVTFADPFMKPLLIASEKEESV